MSFFVTGGTLPPDAASYVSRQADADLLDGLRAGEFCYVLDTRQMGKSSLMVRAAAQLADEGATVIAFDLTALGQNVTAEQWYDGLLHQLGRELDREDEVDDFRAEHRHLGPLQRWMAALRQIAVAQRSGPVVVFVDEIDIVRSLPFSTDEFFAGIRECYNQRAGHPEMRRLTFCLLGVATPSRLIRDTRVTPFNIGRRIDLRDFTADEAAPLAAGLDRRGDGAVLLRRVLWWTGGHPYLTQRLCQAVAEEPQARTAAGVDRVCEALFLSRPARERDSNLLFVRDRLQRAESDVAATLDLYGRIRAGHRVRADDLQSTVVALTLAGIVRADAGRLRVRNRIYARVFDPAWVRERMPDAELRRQRAAYRRGLARASSLAAAVFVTLTVLALTAVTYAQRAQKSELDADRRATDARRASIRANALKRQADAAAADALQQKRAARDAAQLAERRRGEALASARESQERSSQLMVAYGARLQEEGDLYGSLLWYAQAARIDTDDPARQRVHGLRLAATLRQVPRLVAMRFQVDAPRHCRDLSPDGERRMVRDDRAYHKGWVADARTGKHLVALVNGDAGLGSLTFSPDGQRVAADNARHQIQIWDSRTGRAVVPPLAHHGTTQALAFSPDSRWIASGDDDGALRLWDAATGRLATPPLSHRQAVSDLAFSPDGRQMATCSWDGTARVWDTATGAPLSPPLRHGARVLTVAFDTTGARVTTVDDARIARTWEIAGLGAPDETVGEWGNVAAAAFSPDGRYVATGDFDWGARVWDAATGAPVGPMLAHRSAVRALAFSPDGLRLATGSDDRNARLWDVATGRLLALLPHTDKVWQLAFSPDGARLLTTAGNAGALWETSTGRRIASLRGHTLEIRRIAFSPDARRIATVGNDATVCVWDAATGREVMRLRLGSPGADVGFRDGSRLLVTGARDGRIQYWDLATRKPAQPTIRTEWQTTMVAIAQDGRTLLSSSALGDAQLWDAATGRPRGLPLRHQREIAAVAFSPDSRYVATASRDLTAQVWDTATGQPLTPPLRHGASVRKVLFSPDSRRLLTLCDDGQGRIWRLPPPIPNPRSVRRLIEILAARHLNEQGGASALGPAELQAAWHGVPASLRAGIGPSADQKRVWRRAQAIEDIEAGAWDRAAERLDRIVAEAPADRRARALRLSTNARRGRWSEVAADSAALNPDGAWLLVLDAHRPVTRSGTALACQADHKILVVTPGPARRFLATGQVLPVPTLLPTGDYQLTVGVADRSVLVAPHPAGTLIVAPMHGATAFRLEVRHTGKDGDARWIDGRIELEDGRTLRLADLPIRPFGGL